MMIHVTDGQVVGEALSTIFTVLQQGPVAMSVFIKNSGVNTLNYNFQQYNGSAWVDLGTTGDGTVGPNTLMAGEVKSFQVTSSYPQVQMTANASGGAFLDLSVTRYWNRASGGALPILAL